MRHRRLIPKWGSMCEIAARYWRRASEDKLWEGKKIWKLMVVNLQTKTTIDWLIYICMYPYTHTHIHTYIHTVPTTQPARGWNCTKRQKTSQKWSLFVKLCQHGICILNVNSDLHRKIGVRTAIQLQMPPSSPSHPIVGGPQWFRIVPAKRLRSNVSVPGSFDLISEIPSGASFHTVEVLGCWLVLF